MNNYDKLRINVNKTIDRFEKMGDTPQRRQLLSKIRYSLSGSTKYMNEVIPILFYYAKYDTETLNGWADYEKAYLIALQLYALNMQGSTKIELEFEDNYHNFGKTLNILRIEESDRKAMDRRFNTMVTSTTDEELIKHLTLMFKLLKSKGLKSKINFGNLATDLYAFFNGYDEGVRINWSRNYYYFNEEQKND